MTSCNQMFLWKFFGNGEFIIMSGRIVYVLSGAEKKFKNLIWWKFELKIMRMVNIYEHDIWRSMEKKEKVRNPKTVKNTFFSLGEDFCCNQTTQTFISHDVIWAHWFWQMSKPTEFGQRKLFA